MRTLTLPTSLLLSLALLACGGGEDRSKAQLRLVNASSGYASLDLVVDDERLQSGVSYGQSTGYVEVDPDQTETRITRPGSSTALASATPSVAESKRYTLVAYGGEGSLKTVLLDENADDPDAGKARLRVLNAAPDAGGLDVYLTSADASLSDAEALQAGAAVGTLNGFVNVDAATWRLRITGADDREDLRLDLSGLVLASRQTVTVVLTPGSGGVLVNALVITQRASVAALEGASARVRAVAATTDSGAVAATVNGVTLMNGTGSLAIGRYLLVPAGAAGGSVSVNGAEVSLPAATLAAGSDHTLMVWGPATTPSVAWIADDNRPPSVAGKARLRLVHGVAELPAALAVTLDFSPVADGVAGGTASAGALVTPTADGMLTVTGVGLSSALWTDPEVVVAAGGVYTLFVLGPASAPTGILRRDR